MGGNIFNELSTIFLDLDRKKKYYKAKIALIPRVSVNVEIGWLFGGLLEISLNVKIFDYEIAHTKFPPINLIKTNKILEYEYLIKSQLQTRKN